MARVTFTFDTRHEASVFKVGLEYVNDGQICDVQQMGKAVTFVDYDQDEDAEYNMGKPKEKRGRPLTAGRFETREQLLDRICTMYWLNGRSVAACARNARISEHTAHKIIESPEAKEWRMKNV